MRGTDREKLTGPRTSDKGEVAFEVVGRHADQLVMMTMGYSSKVQCVGWMKPRLGS